MAAAAASDVATEAATGWVTLVGAPAHLDEDQRAVGVAQDQVDFTPAAPGRPIIAHQQPQARALQMLQGAVFGGIAKLLFREHH